MSPHYLTDTDEVMLTGKFCELHTWLLIWVTASFVRFPLPSGRSRSPRTLGPAHTFAAIPSQLLKQVLCHPPTLPLLQAPGAYLPLPLWKYSPCSVVCLFEGSQSNTKPKCVTWLTQTTLSYLADSSPGCAFATTVQASRENFSVVSTVCLEPPLFYPQTFCWFLLIEPSSFAPHYEFSPRRQKVPFPC